MLMYLRLLKRYPYFIFEDILTLSMSRDLPSKIDIFLWHMDMIKRRNDEAPTMSLKTRAKKGKYRIAFQFPIFE